MDRAAWDIFVKEVYDRYYLRVCEFAYRLVGCREAARDIAQDAFVVLLESQSRISSDTAVIKSYLYSTVKNVALNRIRRQNMAARIHVQHRMDEAEETSVIQAMVHAEIIGDLHAALDALPEKCANVCKMAYLEGKKNQEIAEELGVSVNTIKTQKQRAIFLLRNKISPQFFAVILLLFSS